MVLSERNTNTDTLRNGRRSRGPSPNSPASTDSDSEEEVGMSPIANSYAGEKIRVGRDYQAGVPDFIPLADRRLDQCPEKALLVWSPTIDISDMKVDEYISLAKEKYSYNGEQALGMLFWHKHDLERAILDLANFTPFPDEWTVEDKVLFEQAFQFHGKSFHRIRQMLPDKPIAILVKYYYTWKKTRMRTSVMDKLARKMANRAAGAGDDGQGSDNASDFGSNTDSDSDEKKWPWIHRGIRRKSGSPPRIMLDEVIKKEKGAEGGGDVKSSCTNCGVACTQAQATPKGAVCNTCFTHWRRTGNARPITGPLRPPRERLTHSMLMRQKRKPPRGMYINHDDLVAIASGTGQGEEMLRGMDREIVSLKRQVQNNKQRLSSVKRKTSHESECQRPQESTSRLNGRWTNDELLLAVQGMRQYGKDFLAIAEVIGTKSEAHLRTFYVNYRRRYNLDAVLTEYEAEHGPIVEDEKEVDENSRPEKGGTSPPTATTPIPPPTTATIGTRQ